ncbi:polyphosphate kinase 2 family protein [Taklimakanibacter deserti]|uniref:polyphosphate kinase 2 family protein n=1 Tax=Taklimakanibacter deserti TaxID=2267839 RepID=UPI000E65B2A2
MPSQFAKKFIVGPGKAVSLAKIDPRDDSAFKGKDQAKAQTQKDAEAIDALQDKLYAEGKHSLLVVLQGIDCSGKDGTVRAVFNTCGPIGVEVTPFKVPSPEERAHDYLWRVHEACPEKGIIGIFNRSHYEDVLVVKVRKLAKPDVIERRYEEINQFEKMLSDNGTRILKFMLHISKAEQAERLKERVTDPAKQWKFNPSDLEDRKLWNDYMAAYETALRRCSTAHAPWYVIPADRNWARNAAISRIVREALEELAPKYPPPDGWDPKTVVVK